MDVDFGPAVRSCWSCKGSSCRKPSDGCAVSYGLSLVDSYNCESGPPSKPFGRTQ